MDIIEEDEDNVMVINDFKIKWFTLLSRVDASPTVDEMVLSSLNSIANLLISHRPAHKECDFLFNLSLKMGIFESIFRWNFVFSGADLEAFKSKELQFYDILITGEGKFYLHHPEFALPLLATLHHCAIRSCLAVERVLVRTLNSVCVALCSQYPEIGLRETTPVTPDLNLNGSSQEPMTSGELILFRRWCLGLIDPAQPSTLRTSDGDLESSSDHAVNWKHNPNEFQVNEFVDWTWNMESKPNTSVGHSSFESSIQDKLPSIDSVFDLLVPFVFREGDLAWQARDALLLVSTYSLKDDEFSYGVAEHSSVCPVLATGLATLYAELPRRLVNTNLPEEWPALMQALDEQESRSAKFNEFLNALDFCQSVLEVAHPLIQTSLLHYVHSGFFVSVLGFSLTQTNVADVITATVYLKQLILHIANSALLPALLRFLLTQMPVDTSGIRLTTSTPNPSHSTDPDYEDTSVLSADLTEASTHAQFSAVHSTAPTYMDLLISRLHYCNTLLGVATLSLFNTLISLNCEDVMLYLVLRYLVPFRDALLSIGWVWPEANTLAKSAGCFLDLIAIHEETVDIWKSSDDWKSVARPSHGSIAELNLDDDLDGDDLEGEWCGMSPDDCRSSQLGLVNGHVHTTNKSSHSVKLNGEPPITMETLMPVHSESRLENSLVELQPVVNGTAELPINLSSIQSRCHVAHRCYQRQTFLTPDDWLNYTSWARDAIVNRASGCAEWRLTFDETQPLASHLNGFEQNLQQFLSGDGDASIQHDSTSVTQDRSECRRKHSLALLQSRFKYFTSKPPGVEEWRQKVGQRTAQALRLAMDNLDLDAEFDLDGLNHDSSLQDKRVTDETDFQLQQNGTQSKHVICNGDIVKRHSSLDERTSNDSDCSVVLAKSWQDNTTSKVVQLKSSVSDYQVASRGPFCNLSNSCKIKSWYRLYYLDNDLCELPGDMNESDTYCAVSGTLSNKNEFCGPGRPLSTGKVNGDVQALLRANKVDCSVPEDHSIEQDGLSDLSTYFNQTLAETHVLSQENNLIPPNGIQEIELPPNDTEVTYLEPPGHQCLNGSDVKLQCNLAEQSVSTKKPRTENHTTTETKSCTNTSECQHFAASTPDHSSHPSTYALLQDFSTGFLNSSSTHFLGTLARRHSLGSRLLSVNKGIDNPQSGMPTFERSNNICLPSLGPFLTTILARLESLPHNCFYANLYLTNLLSSLTAFPIPLLKTILLLVPQANTLSNQEEHSEDRTLHEICSQLPYAVLSSIRKQLDLFAVQYASTGSQTDHGLSFMDLIADAKRYFRTTVEPNRSVDNPIKGSVNGFNGHTAGNGKQFTTDNPDMFFKVYTNCIPIVLSVACSVY
ncbi:hypothetical protein EG68_02959 [Paragonimus skrjabini miyazakii]|uniref:FHF complex subunit HOOK-interacting protein C-terminal domain-containing protein n=1 Tax=Paragonimus skrjabini miyazakii TaxID=59628 RepID=A0A8S9Z1Z1_9TREM|nr:hypothetical protein EG68_02959 [Paragonimus skrjabini miyazakii]